MPLRGAAGPDKATLITAWQTVGTHRTSVGLCHEGAACWLSVQDFVRLAWWGGVKSENGRERKGQRKDKWKEQNLARWNQEWVCTVARIFAGGNNLHVWCKLGANITPSERVRHGMAGIPEADKLINTMHAFCLCGLWLQNYPLNSTIIS